MSDPLDLAIKAFNDMPNTRFRQPVGPYRTTYELVAYLQEIRWFSGEIMQAKTPDDMPDFKEVFMYFYPAS